MLNLKQPFTAHTAIESPLALTRLERGRWCNFCGARLLTTAALMNGYERHHRVEWTEASGKAASWSLCEKCYEVGLRCVSCGEHVGAQAVMLEGETRVYCRDCFEQRPRCDTCGRPVGAHYWTRTDGRTLCDRCQSTSVSDPAYAHTLYRRVRATLVRNLGMALREPCQLKMAGRGQLVTLIEKSTLHSLDADSRGRCFGLFMREGKHRAIFVEYGLPQIVLLEVLAHEYAHAWQSENCPADLPTEVQEGFAEWVAYKLLQQWGCTIRMERMLRRDDIYGRGLRHVLQWERYAGQAEVFRRIKHEV